MLYIDSEGSILETKLDVYLATSYVFCDIIQSGY